MKFTQYMKNLWSTLADSLKKKDTGGTGAAEAETGTQTGQERTAEAKGAASGLDNLSKYIEQQYGSFVPSEKPELPDVPSYDRLAGDGRSDDEIKKQAESLLSDYANKGKNAIESEIEALEAQYGENKKNAESAYQSNSKELESIYETAQENTSNDMLKRGLARSSIAANKTSALESEKADKKTQMHNAYTEAVTALDNEISGLEAKRQKAIADFDIAYAAKLTEQILSLTKDRDEKQKEALKYNNSLTEKEYNAANDKVINEDKLYTSSLSQADKEKELGKLTAAQQKQIFENIFAEMDKYLSALSAKEAKELISGDPMFRDNLSDYYYYKLLDKYGR